MNEKIVRDHLVKLLNGGHAFVTFDQALKNVRPEKRNSRPPKEIHSIWENLEHMRIAQEDILNYALDPKWKSPDWPKRYWPEGSGPINDKIWSGSIDGFLKDRREIINIAKDEKINLTSIIPHTKEHTYFREILLVAEHNAYHLGQIVIVRKLLNDW
jgi:DinB superfamily